MIANDAIPTDWNNRGNAELRAYHAKQWAEEKQSTAAIATFLADELAASSLVIDLACGAGGASASLARRHPSTHFIGIDYAPECIETAAALTAGAGIENLTFEQADLYALPPRIGVDGVICLQTLSWLPSYEAALLQIATKISPRWIAFSSLFHEGDISCAVQIREHAKDTHFFYNVYALPELRRFCSSIGYAMARTAKFEIGIDLPKPADSNVMGTYTERVIRGESFERLQISGPLLMPWYNVLLEAV